MYENVKQRRTEDEGIDINYWKLSQRRYTETRREREDKKEIRRRIRGRDSLKANK